MSKVQDGATQPFFVYRSALDELKQFRAEQEKIKKQHASSAPSQEMRAKSKEDKKVSKVTEGTGYYNVQKVSCVTLDPNEVSTATINYISDLVDKVAKMKDGDYGYENNGLGYMKFSKDDYEKELQICINRFNDPYYREFEKTITRVPKFVEGAFQTYAGYTEMETGYAIASLGSWMVVTIPLGVYMAIDGVSNAGEGIHKMRNALRSSDTKSFNFLRDMGYKKVWGGEKGEQLYNKVSIVAGIVCITNGVVSIKKANMIKNINQAAFPVITGAPL